MTSVLTKIIYVDKSPNLSLYNIEQILASEFGPILRWAIVDVTNNKLKICITYER